MSLIFKTSWTSYFACLILWLWASTTITMCIAPPKSQWSNTIHGNHTARLSYSLSSTKKFLSIYASWYKNTRVICQSSVFLLEYAWTSVQYFYYSTKTFMFLIDPNLCFSNVLKHSYIFISTKTLKLSNQHICRQTTKKKHTCMHLYSPVPPGD